MLTSTITNEAPRVNTNNVSYPAGTFEFPSGVADIVAIPFTNSTESISAVNVPASAEHVIVKLNLIRSQFRPLPLSAE